MPSSPEQPQWADIKEPKKVETSGFEIAHTPDLDKAVEKADEIAKAIQEDKPVTFGQFLEMKEALEKAIESDPRIEAKRLFGEGFIGVDEIERHFTLESGEKLFEYTAEQRQEINRKLREKLDDPQIRVLIERTPKEELTEKFQLVMFPDRFADGTPVTMKALYERFQPEMERRGQGKLLSGDVSNDWYAKDNEIFYVSNSRLSLEWKLVSKGNIENSEEHDAYDETVILREYLRANDLAIPEELVEASDEKIYALKQLDRTNWREALKQFVELKINQKYRMEPLQVIFLHCMNKTSLGADPFKNNSTRTAKCSLSGNLVVVGAVDAKRGMNVFEGVLITKLQGLGVSISC